jgi:gliding motility-associated lipoprotein GldH
VKYYSYLIFLALIITTASCDSNRIFEQNIDFVGETWHKDSILTFDVQINDSNAIYNVYINNRINGQYKYNNMYLFVTTQLPYNHILRDTLECILAEADGKWLGKGFGNIWSNKIPYRKNVKFPYSGNYAFKLEQAMRDDELKHVSSAGIRIEKVK